MKYIIHSIGGLRGLALGLLEGALLFGALVVMVALMFAVAPMVGM